MTEQDRPDWVSQRAVAWVIDDAPVPAELAWTLLVIARRCDQRGRGSWQRLTTIAEKVGKSRKQTRRDVIRLCGLGLLVLGDQGLVAHLPAGQRPTVYDVALTVKGPKPGRAARNKLGINSKPTPPFHGRGPTEGTPGIEGTPTPPLDSPGTPPMEGSQIRSLKNPVEEPSLSTRDAELSDSTVDRERDEDVSESEDPNRLVKVALLAEFGVADRAEAAYLVAEIERTRRVGLGWWRTVAKNGDLAAIVKGARDQLAREPPTGPVPSSSCGQCNTNRQVELPDGRMARCPRCHPLNRKEDPDRDRPNTTAGQRADG